MEIKEAIKKIRERGFTIKPFGADIFLSPKKNLDERMVDFVKKHKEKILLELSEEEKSTKKNSHVVSNVSEISKNPKPIVSNYDSHFKKKSELNQYRLHVLRVTVKNYLKSKDSKQIEDFIDQELQTFNYDLEELITYVRGLVLDTEYDLFGVCMNCKLMPPFCKCEKPSYPPFNVACDDCEHFEPSKYSEAGIGKCGRGHTQTLSIKGRVVPLHRFTRRQCNDFSKYMR